MNLDYILLVESGLLVMMAIAAGALARLELTRRWPLLGGFAATQVVHTWAELVAADLGPSDWNTSLQFLTLASGAVLLLEFASRDAGWFRTGPRFRAVVYSLLLLLAWIATWRGGGVGLARFLCGSGTVIAAAAGWVMLRTARTWSSPATAWRLRVIGGLLPVYVFAETLPAAAPVWATLFPSEILAHGPSFCFAAALSLCVYIHNALLQKNRLPAAAARAWRQRRYLCIAAVWVVVLFGWFIADRTAAREDATMRRQILNRTTLAAAAIDPDLARALTWDASDLERVAYRTLKRRMISLHQANDDVRFALLAGLDRGQSFFLVDSEPPASPDYSPPGQPYSEAAPDYLRGMAEGRPFALGPVVDRWGIWIISSVPLVQLADGRTINMELDVAASDWALQIRRARLPVVLITLLISMLIIGFFQAQERLRENALQMSLSEQRMRAARDAAEAATRAKSDFLAVMSHELRTPLAGVIGMLDLLRRGPPAAARKKYTAVARDSAETLLRILDDILDSAKIEAGRLTLETISFRPHDTFRHLCEAARLRAETKSVDFRSVITSAVPEVLVGDPTRLRQVLGNLQNNALKFTEHGEVTVEIDARPRDAATVDLLIRVRDTGCGISPEHRARLFGKFEQADRSTTRRYGGTGLGLSIVKALADTMGGSVEVESEPGRGSTFTFTAPLPIGQAASAPIPADEASTAFPRPAVPLSILCAEDDAVNRLVAESVLAHLGHRVEFAIDGERALDCLRRRRYDLVLMDGRMPVLDGFKATRLIRSGEAGVLDPHVYICAATANVAEADRKRCAAAGMNDYVKKPLDERAVFDALQRATAWLATHGIAPVAEAAEPAAAPHAPGLSEAELLASLDADAAPPASTPSDFPPETLQRLSAIFWEQAPAQVRELRAAFEAGDAAKIGDLAHALKSSAHYIGAPQLSGHMAELERLAAAHRLADCAAPLAAAEAECARLHRAAALQPASS